jgi:hypothetical protein
MPAVFANGSRIQDPNSVDAIQSAIDAELATAAPIAVGVSTSLGATELEVTVDVWGLEAGIPDNLALFTCVIETEVTLDGAPNGLTEYRNVLRHLFRAPNPPGDLGGDELGTIDPGERIHFDYIYPLPGAVDPSRLAAIAFAQDRATRRVVQVGSSLFP